MILRVTLVIIAAWLVAAHFLRSGNLLLVAFWALMPLLFLVKRRWSLLALQLLVYVGAVIWLSTMIQLVIQRMMLGQSWGGVVVILGSVTLVTIVAGLLLNSPVIKARYPSGSPDEAA